MKVKAETGEHLARDVPVNTKPICFRMFSVQARQPYTLMIVDEYSLVKRLHTYLEG